jgi:hypothetical protein
MWHDNLTGIFLRHPLEIFKGRRAIWYALGIVLGHSPSDSTLRKTTTEQSLEHLPL